MKLCEAVQTSAAGHVLLKLKTLGRDGTPEFDTKPPFRAVFVSRLQRYQQLSFAVEVFM